MAYHRSISRVSELGNDAQFVVIVDDSYQAMGDNYGPPDPPPTMETHNFTRVIGFKSEADLLEWIADNSKERHPKAFKALRYQPLTITSEVKVSLS